MEVTLLKAEAISYLEQLLHLQTNLEESKNHQLEVEMEGKNHPDMLVVEVECLKEELVNSRVSEEGNWVNKKKTFLESPEFFDLFGA